MDSQIVDTKAFYRISQNTQKPTAGFIFFRIKIGGKKKVKLKMRKSALCLCVCWWEILLESFSFDSHSDRFKNEILNAQNF